ncbi:MAG: YqeG family HAD IIIA-type phosphatase [Clostridia bacterium]|nr:YqeG family HAD IIIA-type phosphatase [Clostridia bacterium]
MLLKPKIKLKRITDISLSILKKYDIDTLILDVDNTMSTHHGQVLTDGLSDWIDMMHKNNIGLIVLSNSKEQRVKPFAEKINLPYISLGLKPLPFGYFKALKKGGSKRKNTAIVGDQIFTDILGGNIVGVKTILLTPIKPEDGISFKIRRKIEKFLFKIYKIKDLEEI